MTAEMQKNKSRCCSANGAGNTEELNFCRSSFLDIFDRIDQRIDDRNHAAAQRLLRYVSRLYKDNEFILEQIAVTAEVLGDWEMVYDALETLISEFDDSEDIGDMIFQSVRLLVEKLNRPNDALELIHSHFISYVRQPGSIEWTGKHLVQGAFRDQIIAIAKSSFVNPLHAIDNVHICNALGSWYTTSYHDRHRAYRWYRKVLEIHPGNPEAIDGLISLHHRTA